MNSFRNLIVEESPSSAYLELLGKNTIGTPGVSIVYQQVNSLRKVHHLANPYFVHLIKKKRIIASCCLLRRPIANLSSPGYYIRYFTLEPKFRRPFSSSRNHKKNSAIKMEFRELLIGCRLNPKDSSLFFYAYVDPENIRSQKLCDEFGFVSIGKFSTLTFSRFLPKPRLKIEKLDKRDYQPMRDLLNKQYGSFSMVNFENLFYQGNYYVFRDANDEIILGAQVNPELWKILQMPNKVASFLFEFSSRIPILKRVLNKHYHFLGIECLYIKDGAQADLSRFLESLLYEFQRYSILISLDTRSLEYEAIKDLDLGLLNLIKKETIASIIIKSHNLPESDLNFLENAPAYISTFDLT